MTTLKGLLFAVAFMIGSTAQVQSQLVQLVANHNQQTIATTDSNTEVISAYQEGLAIIVQEGKFGYINKQGLEICMPKFDEARLFQNGYAAVKKHGKWTFVNKQGKKIAPFRYTWVGNFNNQVAPVQLNGKWGYINEQGFEITEIKYDEIKPFQKGKALGKYNGQWFYIDEQTGEASPAPQSLDVETFTAKA